MKYTFLTAKNGDIVPAINDLPLHSMVDPAREAQKLLTTIPCDAGFIVFLGLGGGYAPLAALENTDAEVAVIDYNKEYIKKLLESKDYSALLNNKRFTLLIDPSNAEINSFILTNYKPSLHGGIKTIPLRTRADFDKDTFESCVNSIQTAISIVSSDYTVQAHFGKRWFCNIIRNIAYMRENTRISYAQDYFPENILNAAVVAAGPSLDRQINELAKLKDGGCFIICADTALGALLHNGIKPNVIVSIDCQYKSYYHFMNYKNYIKDIPLVLDIASPPMLAELSDVPLFFASGHPLARYISGKFVSLNELDTSGGNVAYACFALARDILRAENIILLGADFAYIKSQSYARGSYVMPYFEERQNRFKTLETQSSVFLFRSPFLEAKPGQIYRETAQLKFYRERLEEKAGVKIKPGSGKPILISQSARKHQEHRVRLNCNLTPVEFLKNYRDKIAGSPDNDVLTTLLPFAAFIKHRKPSLKTQEVINETKRVCIEEINKFL